MVRLGLFEIGQHFTNYLILVPKKFQRLLNTLQAIIKTKDRFFSFILAYDENINSIYIDHRYSLENIQLFASVRCRLFGVFFTDI